MKSGVLGTVSRVGVSFGAIALILYLLRDKLHKSFFLLRTDVVWQWFILALAIYLVANAVLTFRLRYVFEVQGIHMTFKDGFYLVMLGLFFNLFFPSAVGGDVAKAYFAYKHSGKKIEATTSVILDRLMGFVSLILMALIAVLIYSKELDDPRINNLIYIFLILMLLSLLFFGSKRFASLFKFLEHAIPSEKWRQRIKDTYHAIYGYKNHLGVLMLVVAFSFFGQCLFIMAYYTTTLSLGVDMAPWIFFILVPIISIVSMAPSLGGLGVREASVIYLFSRFMTTERALAITLLLDVIIYGVSIFGGIIYALRGGLKAKVIHEIEALE